MTLRRTKILATLGPATDDATVFQQLVEQGVDIVRLNLSHGTHEGHEKRVALVRQCAQACQKEIGILADLQGPKVRIAKFKDGEVTLKAGDAFALDADIADDIGDSSQVGVDYKALPKDVKKDDCLLLDDGRIELVVNEVQSGRVNCTVKVGGVISDHKGINKQGGGLSASALTNKDIEDIAFAAKLDIDYFAVSFPRDAKDIEYARKLVREANSQAGIIAKIERVEAIHNILEIIEAADGIMVARGDLGVEIGDAALPGVQKRMIHEARSSDKLTITATQMMESMIEKTIPTRAEVFDVANAVLDGTDAVMLSGETAVGKHPVKVIEAVSRICLGAEKERSAQISSHRISEKFERIDETIAMTVMYAANHTDVKAIITFTESGATPLWMSRINSSIPIFAFSRHQHTLRKMSLFRGVIPIFFEAKHANSKQLGEEAIEELMKRDAVKHGDQIIITRGNIWGVHGGTNRLKIVRAGVEQGM